MIRMMLSEVADACGGQLHGDDVAITGGVFTDSRECGTGSLYVARVGEHSDGHVFAPNAARAGAVACLGSKPVDVMPTVVVEDVQLAFAKLARAVIDRLPQLEIVGITGSSGKTSTKDLLGAVLAHFAPTIAPVGSLNSEIGVPLTVCRITEEHRYLVAEMGANGVGHIEYLTKIAPPKVGIVLNVGKAHMGEFGSVEAIAQTKGELVEALGADGYAILNADDERVAAMASRTKGKVIMVGRAEGADFRATDVSVDATGRAAFTLSSPHGTAQVRLAVYGEHQVGNSLSVIAAATALGLPQDDVVAALAEAKATSRWRMELFELPRNVTLINDAYNANPDSMRAAVRSLATMGAGRRRVAVLGGMLELGESSDAEHAAIGQVVAESGIEQLVVVGEVAGPIASGAAQSGMPASAVRTVNDADAALAWLKETTKPGDILIFKSSRDSGMRVLGDQLVDESKNGSFPATEETS